MGSPRLSSVLEQIRFLASSSWDERTVLWDVAGRKAPRPVWKDTAGGGHLDFAPDSRVLAWSKGQAVHLLDIGTRKEIPLQPGDSRRIGFVGFAGRRTVVSAGGKVRTWNAATGKELRTSTRRLNTLLAAALGPDGKTLVTGSYDGTILWDLSTGKPLRSFIVKNGYARATAFSPNGKMLATAIETQTLSVDTEGRARVLWEQEERLRLWDVATGKELGRFGEARGVLFLTFSPDGKRLAAVSNPIRVWDVASGKLVAEMAKETRAPIVGSAVSFSRDGKLLAAGGWDKTIYLWEVVSGKAIREFRGHQGWIHAVVFSPDGKTLASAGYDDTVRLWEVSSGKLRHEITGHRDEVLAVAFSPDGTRLASASADTTVLVWDLAGLGKVVQPPAAPITPQEFRGLWADLGARSRHRLVDRSMGRLVAVPGSAVPLLKQHLFPVPAPDKRVRRLLADLDSDRFPVRQNAFKELENLGAAAAPTLRLALAGNPSVEVRRQLARLLKAVNEDERRGKAGKRELTPEELRLVRAAVVLARIGTPKAADALQGLAGDPRLQKVLKSSFSQRPLIKEAKKALKKLSTPSPVKP